MERIKQFWLSMSPKQQAFAVVLLLILLIVLVRFFRQTRKDVERELTRKTENQVLAEQGIKPTYQSEFYKVLADGLEDAFNGPGTYWDIVTQAFSYMNNNADMIALHRAFGLRRSSYWASGLGSLLVDSSDLDDWVKRDLSPGQIQELNEQLENQGVSKQFSA